MYNFNCLGGLVRSYDPTPAKIRFWQQRDKVRSSSSLTMGGKTPFYRDLSKSSVVFCRHLVCGFNYNLEEVDINAHKKSKISMNFERLFFAGWTLNDVSWVFLNVCTPAIPNNYLMWLKILNPVNLSISTCFKCVNHAMPFYPSKFI